MQTIRFQELRKRVSNKHFADCGVQSHACVNCAVIKGHTVSAATVPSQASLALRGDASEKQVQRVLASLEKKGLITRMPIARAWCSVRAARA